MAKTKTSNEVKARYNTKTYRRITVNLRCEDDAQILQRIDNMTSSGMTAPDAVKALLYSAVKNSQE